ncbi:3761_t:CDS:2 [Gigaspora margarita]|uniref:3761_t:CDS:1 n=1 Tax=Gigaspora margarita TaxID=4874 RepID=A0ABN7UUD1_GIGMA|nr:3761_t:CDS:2 [Gigaspora margarita]
MEQKFQDSQDISLDNNTIIYASKWINLENTTSVRSQHPFLGGKANNQIYFIDQLRGLAHIFDATLYKWKLNISYYGVPNKDYYDMNDWISDDKTGKSYYFVGTNRGISIFDTINLTWANSSSIPQILFQTLFQASNLTAIEYYYHTFAQVLLPSNKIFYIGGSYSINTSLIVSYVSMNYILSYDIATDLWQINNTTGKKIEERQSHTAVARPALPYLVVLDVSKMPYEWLTPTEENSIGSLSEHSSIMVKNYMITSFGKNLSARGSSNDNTNVYKLNISNPLVYSWSLLAINVNSSLSDPISNNNYNNTNPFDNRVSGLNKRKFDSQQRTPIDDNSNEEG